MPESKFKLVGLQRGKLFISATLQFLEKEETFNAPIIGSYEKKLAMWRYCEGHWGDNKAATVTHDGFDLCGNPMNPVVTEIYDLNSQSIK